MQRLTEGVRHTVSVQTQLVAFAIAACTEGTGSTTPALQQLRLCTLTLQWLVRPEDVVLLMLKSEAGFSTPQRLQHLAPTVGAATCQ